jgi:hypothetical protein
MKRLAGFPYRFFDKALRSSLWLLEYKRLTSSTRKLDYPPIFIVGPPRSGSTLLYQLMVHCFHLAYFPNIADRYNTAPVIATKFGLRHCKPYASDFTSKYGVIEGRMAPHEAGGIWNRWYPTEYNDGYNYTGAGYFHDNTKHIIYQTVAGIEELFDAPFINKNVKNSVRILSLVEIFPEALFIQIRRDPFDNANSILKSRRERNQSVNDWWSVMPKEIELLRGKNYFEQVCGQVFYVEKNIAEDITRVGRGRLHVVHYEKLCDYPKKELHEVSVFVSAHGCDLNIKYDVPKAFESSKYKRGALSDEEEMMRKTLARYYEAAEIYETSQKHLQCTTRIC